jgi:hypothetical protein
VYLELSPKRNEQVVRLGKLRWASSLPEFPEFLHALVCTKHRHFDAASRALFGTDCAIVPSTTWLRRHRIDTGPSCAFYEIGAGHVSHINIGDNEYTAKCELAVEQHHDAFGRDAHSGDEPRAPAG